MSYAAFGLPTPDQCAAWDRRASDIVPLRTLMENAGRACARAIRRHMAPARTLVLCGPGNNGGDGYVVARHLAQAGWPVSVAAMAEPKPGTDAHDARAGWRGPMVPFSPDEASRAGLVIDAVFGAGLSRDVDDVIAETLHAARRIVAVDMPSGVDGATGSVRGAAAPCLLTVTFGRPKPGHLLLPGQALAGELVVADIGMPPGLLAEIGIDTWVNEPGLWHVPESGLESHKYSRGVVSLCGGAAMPGAARLAAAGARASGAGLVRIAAGPNAGPYKLGAPGLIVDSDPLDDLLRDERRKTWICGPGLTVDEVAHTLPTLLKAERTVLADAGALAWATEDLSRLRGVSAITPHIGEFSKLFGNPGADRLGAARAAAARIDAVVILKGADTIIASPDGRAAINVHASSALATAGSGDTLSGVIATLLAAGMAPWDACGAGVWLHGDAGLHAGDWPIAEDLDRHLGAARARAIRQQATRAR
ncbi:bifunctional ADP-dependent NAD(P)H-hydrate dehydratase/NAD(P)H-hydrate epimerase [Tanticharoenia sakaeratensis]|nr:bifunctional ADP-dependent NAD(P)H-hydrate dehydratase/NAD(P)H-hydrate epimerase [Tanticharoenia sakaeratensis]